jgi:ankyrin repeat protein
MKMVIERDIASHMPYHGTGEPENALHNAAKKGNFFFVVKLVRQAADPLALNAQGFTPAEVATRNGHLKCYEYLKLYEELHEGGSNG